VRKAYLFPYVRVRDRIAIDRFVHDIPMDDSHRSYATLEKIANNLWVLQYKPTAILWGGKDWCFHGGILDQWRGIFPDAYVKVFPNAGHYVLEDASGEIEKDIRRFIVSKQSVTTHDGSVAPAPSSVDKD
jgi:haloalkane dehalogenase